MGETIVAVSSPPGRAMRGLVRLSGPAAHEVLGALLDHPSIDALHERHLTRARLRSPPLPTFVSFNHSPHSYTGDTTAELQAPGHPALLERMMQQAIAAGARLAEPGEFTFRAFTAGKLDLTQAEGVAATIAATSDSQLRAASMLTQGRLGSLSSDLVDRLSDTLALVEASIDFSDEEDVTPITPAVLADRLAAMRSRLDELLTRSRSWGEVEALPRVVLAGPPSSGKTALFNALLGRERAVVSAAHGTTRDVLAEPMTVIGARGEPCEVMLVDLAGLDEPAGALDTQMQQAAKDAIDRADLVLRLRAADQPAEPASPIDLSVAAASLLLLTKADLGEPGDRAPEALSISAVTGWQIEALKQRLVERLGAQNTSLSADMLALQPRHEQAIRTALERFDAALTLIEPWRASGQLGEVEIIADHLRGGLDALAGLGGRMSPDDVLGKVFSTFCIGK